jgi:hypothetical protein
MDPSQPPIQSVLGPIFLRVKRYGLETHCSPLSSVEIKNGGAVPPPLYAFHGIVLH